MIHDDLLQCLCISSSNSFKPTSSAVTFNQTDYPCTTSMASSVILSMKEIALVHFDIAWLTVGIKTTQLLLLVVQDPVLTLQTKIIVLIDYRVPADKFFKQHYMFEVHFVDPIEKHHDNLLSQQYTMSKE